MRTRLWAASVRIPARLRAWPLIRYGYLLVYQHRSGANSARRAHGARSPARSGRPSGHTERARATCLKAGRPAEDGVAVPGDRCTGSAGSHCSSGRRKWDAASPHHVESATAFAGEGNRIEARLIRPFRLLLAALRVDDRGLGSTHEGALCCERENSRSRSSDWRGARGGNGGSGRINLPIVSR